MDKLQTPKGAVEGRNAEILVYQISIDNYERAVAKVNKEYADKPETLKFRDNSIEPLEAHRLSS